MASDSSACEDVPRAWPQDSGQGSSRWDRYSDRRRRCSPSRRGRDDISVLSKSCHGSSLRKEDTGFSGAVGPFFEKCGLIRSTSVRTMGKEREIISSSALLP